MKKSVTPPQLLIAIIKASVSLLMYKLYHLAFVALPSATSWKFFTRFDMTTQAKQQTTTTSALSSLLMMRLTYLFTLSLSRLHIFKLWRICGCLRLLMDEMANDGSKFFIGPNGLEERECFLSSVFLRWGVGKMIATTTTDKGGRGVHWNLRNVGALFFKHAGRQRGILFV